ncbi:MAG: hypothetical protein Q8S54_09870 [Bacteroidota bacterium]|nr:hypothetical protein [Bacteroidota bacterium]
MDFFRFFIARCITPKIKASAGMTTIDTPGTTNYDIPTSIPQSMMIHSRALR